MSQIKTAESYIKPSRPSCQGETRMEYCEPDNSLRGIALQSCHFLLAGKLKPLRTWRQPVYPVGGVLIGAHQTCYSMAASQRTFGELN